MTIEQYQYQLKFFVAFAFVGPSLGFLVGYAVREYIARSEEAARLRRARREAEDDERRRVLAVSVQAAEQINPGRFVHIGPAGKIQETPRRVPPQGGSGTAPPSDGEFVEEAVAAGVAVWENVDTAGGVLNVGGLAHIIRLDGCGRPVLTSYARDALRQALAAKRAASPPPPPPAPPKR